MKLQVLQTIQTCHCHRMPGKYEKVTSWHAAAFSDSAEPIPHTRPWRPRHQCRWKTNRCSWRTSLSSAPRPRPGNRDRSRLASSSRALPFKSWSLKSGEHMTFNSDIWISLIQNLANNAESDGCLQMLTASTSTYLTTLLEQRWMMKLQDLQTIQTCHCHRMPGKYEKVTSWHAAAFSDSAEPIPHTRPWRPRHQSCCLPTQCPWRTRLSSAPRPRPGNGDRSRLASSSRALRFKSWSLKFGEHMTFNSNIWISLIQNLANNAESDSCLQHLHIWQLFLNRDEWWNYRTSNLPLSQDAGKVWESDIMTCRSIQRFCGAHPTHQALAPSAPILLSANSMSVTDAFVFSASAKAWKQRQIQAGVFIQGSTVQIVIADIQSTHDI